MFSLPMLPEDDNLLNWMSGLSTYLLITVQYKMIKMDLDDTFFKVFDLKYPCLSPYTDL